MTVEALIRHTITSWDSVGSLKKKIVNSKTSVTPLANQTFGLGGCSF